MLPSAQHRPLLVLTPGAGLFTNKQRTMMRKFLLDADLPAAAIHWRAFHSHTNTTSKRTKHDRFTPPTEEDRQRILRGIYQTNPRLIAIADRTALYTLTGKSSLHLCRGSSYDIRVGDRHYDAVVLGNVLNTLPFTTQRWFKWAYQADVAKLARFWNGTQRPQPEFKYAIVRDTECLSQLTRRAPHAKFIAIDIETWGAGVNSHITCVGLSLHFGDDIETYVIPFHTIPSYDVLPPERVRPAVAEILSSPVPKAMQNGIYDSAHLLRERLVPRNWWIDTAVASHAIWQEAPKTLHFLASMALDNVQYWKDETKTAESANSEEEEPYAFPQNVPDLEQYLLYNAKDAYYTAAITPYYLGHLNLLPWARNNYITTMRQVAGPALYMSMHGIPINNSIRNKVVQDALIESTEALSTLQIMTDNPNFNPSSPTQVQQLLYDTLKIPPLARKGRSTKEEVLKILAANSPLTNRIIQQIWDTKKPANIAAKYGNGLQLHKNRLYYSQSPTGTTSFRYSSRSSHYHTGTNIQNMNKDGPIRAMLEADPGYIIVERDYAQSDAYFTAFSANERKFIADLLGPYDTHCLNAARFFKQDYDAVYQGYRNDEEWVVHSTKGIRQTTKRVVYGANYYMSGYTLFLQMGVRSVVSAAQALGYQGASRWTFDALVQFCERLLRVYFEEIYPDLDPWLKQEIRRSAFRNNVATCIGGLTRFFFGDIKNDNKIQRQFAAFYGQTGTAANVNRSLDRIFYERDSNGNTWLDRGGRLFFQVHDSIVGQVPLGRSDLIDEFAELMDNERISPSGESFKVPGETQVGFGWGKRMIDWIPGKTTLKDVEEHDARWKEKFFPA